MRRLFTSPLSTTALHCIPGVAVVGASVSGPTATTRRACVTTAAAAPQGSSTPAATAAPAATTPSPSAATSKGRPTAATGGRRQLRRHPKLHKIATRELKEEYLRDQRPPKPHVPTGWTLTHEPGANRFDLKKTVEVRGSGLEHLHIIALMEIKEYEHTYRMDNGEREEEEHLIFSLFIEKERWSRPSSPSPSPSQGGGADAGELETRQTSSSSDDDGNTGGGLEFTMTSIDHELVFDNLAIHATKADFDNAKDLRYVSQKTKRDVKYRGPMVSELSEELTDEILDYLDERGVNNGFAEYLLAQAHYIEQSCYEDCLTLLKQFAQ